MRGLAWFPLSIPRNCVAPRWAWRWGIQAKEAVPITRNLPLFSKLKLNSQFNACHITIISLPRWHETQAEDFPIHQRLPLLNFGCPLALPSWSPYNFAKFLIYHISHKMVAIGVANLKSEAAAAQAEAPEFEEVTWYKDQGLRKLYFWAAVLCIASATTGYDG